MKKLHMMFILSLVFCLLELFLFGEVSAVLGPVHVELNTFGEVMGNARANSIASFKIYLRINEDIYPGDWVKIWFPIDEKSCNPDDICDPDFELEGTDEDSRFVPNGNYFKKYKNEKEKAVGKIYEVLNHEDAETTFFECMLCKNEGRCRIIRHPSGLGCFLMGTVFPALPRDIEERKEKLMRIDNSTAFGYSPCGDCGQGYPIIKQTCEERSYQFNSTAHIEAWRQGYNPIDINTSKYTGILPPATPGRYRIRVATKAEPTPVESDAFFLPCSQITRPKLYLVEHRNKDYYSIHFHTGEGGALDRGNSKINIDFPDSFEFKNVEFCKRISVNGSACEDVNLINQDGNSILSITSPVRIENMGGVSILLETGMFENVPDETFTILVNTSSEPETIESFALKDVTNPEESSLIRNLELTSHKANDSAGISFNLDARHLSVNKYTEFRVILPDTSKIPMELQNGQFLINHYPAGRIKRWNENELSLWMNTNHFIEYYSLRSIYFELTEYAGIVNPSIIGVKRLSVKVGKSPQIESDFFFID